MTRLDRFEGCLLGLATGDAVGTTLEFQSPGTFRPLEDMVGGGPFRLKPGEWTDDTSMALCLASSLIEKQGFDPRDQLERYCQWQQHGYMSSTGECFDIGNTVRSALDTFRQTSRPDSGSRSPDSAGNGSIMRLAPVPMYFGQDAREAIDYAGQSSVTTHGATTCVDACRYLGGLIWGALNGCSKEELLSAHYSPLRNAWGDRPFCPEIAAIAAGSFKHRQPPNIRGSGYVVHSLEAALWAFHHSENFRSGCLLAVNLGDDADTTGAVYGQLAGAYYGSPGIPSAWKARLKQVHMITDLARALQTG